MIKGIIKRDGRKESFQISKITDAVDKAFKASNSSGTYDNAENLANQVVVELDERAIEFPTVEQIQDVVESVLVKNGHVRTAKSYILYRADRTKIREMNTRLMTVYGDITFKESKDSDIKRENANVNCDTAMGTMLKYGQEGAKQFYSMFVLKPEHDLAHKEGDIHIHDLDFLTLTTTCCQIDLLKLFHNGFCTGHGVLREPNDIASYSALACIAIQSNQNDQHGGQSIPNFDYAMAEGVKKTYWRKYRENVLKYMDLLAGIQGVEEKYKEFQKEQLAAGVVLRTEDAEEYQKVEFPVLLSYGLDEKSAEKCQAYSAARATVETDRATYQAMEAFIHNLNTMHSRAGAQTPFSSVNYGMDTSPEGRMVTKNVLLAQEAGLGNGEIPIFPIHIFRVKDGVNYNKGDISYDLFKLACRVSSKRLFPNFSFQDAPYNAKYYKGTPETEIAYMGCRTRVIGNVYDPDNEISYGRGNLSFTSINLPRIAIKSKGDISWFFEDLDRKLDLCVEQLLERFEIQAGKKVKNFPFLMGEGIWLDSDKHGKEDVIREVLKHGTFSIGFIGLAETLKALTGKHHGEDRTAANLGLEIIGYMRARLDRISQEKKLNFTLLATPAEGLSGRFVRMDRERYGVIEGVTDRDYYTNSFHVPVYFPIKALEKIKIEAPYHELTNAGHISYVELDGDPIKNLAAFEKVVRAMHDSGIGYGSVNHPVDRDPICGYSGIIDDTCPKCGRREDDVKFERIRRITGYLVGTLDSFNDAKRREVEERVKHNV